jgi:hypothetical protein
MAHMHQVVTIFLLLVYCVLIPPVFHQQTGASSGSMDNTNGDGDMSFLSQLVGLAPIPPPSKRKEFKELLHSGHSFGVSFSELDALVGFCEVRLLRFFLSLY